jgi:predicted NodU family carbamoyl transferase
VYLLGISGYYHDSAAALIKDGEIIAAAQEERFSRKKHDARFPFHAVRYCLSEAKIELSEVTAVTFYDKPLLKFDRLLETYLAYAPVNTSFNVRGEPIVGSVQDAFRCFMRTEMDYLVIENFLLAKSDQIPLNKDIDWKKEFELD